VCRGVNAKRDELELKLLDEAAFLNLPVLCVCRGAQLLAVWGGGHLASQDYDEEHMNIHFSTFRRFGWHRVFIEPHTHLDTIFGNKHIHVNSFHHQTIVASGKLHVTATTKEGVIEGIELPGERFVVGVQWHPELQAFFHLYQQKLFTIFVNAARKIKTDSDGLNY